jgi:rusticyanin
MKMRNRPLVAALVLLLLGTAGILWLAFGVSAQGVPRTLTETGSMMGGGTQGGGGELSYAGLNALVLRGKKGAKIDPKANTVSYNGSAVTLVALASPHGKPDMTWEIDGLVNPTVTVRQGAKVDVILVNTDGDKVHGFELTTTPPPYSNMVMMGINNGFFLMPLPPRTTRALASVRYYTEEGAFTAASGSYYYLCQVPGHAAAGMFGRLVVK